MSEDLPPTLPDAATHGTHPSSILLDENIGPPPGQMRTLPQLASKIKTMPLRLPHPCSLDVLPSTTDKWSATTHPNKGEIFGSVNYTLSYQHFYFHQDRVLHTKAFAVSTTATTVGDGGKPKGSTELDDVTGHNCTMTKEEYATFAVTVLGLRPGLQHGTRQTECSLLNMLLGNFVTLTNIAAVYSLKSPQTSAH